MKRIFLINSWALIEDLSMHLAQSLASRVRVDRRNGRIHLPWDRHAHFPLPLVHLPKAHLCCYDGEPHAGMSHILRTHTLDSASATDPARVKQWTNEGWKVLKPSYQRRVEIDRAQTQISSLFTKKFVSRPVALVLSLNDFDCCLTAYGIRHCPPCHAVCQPQSAPLQ